MNQRSEIKIARQLDNYYILDFGTHNPRVDKPYYSPTPTPDTETLPELNIQAQTKSGRFPPRTNSLLNDGESKKYNNQLTYHRAEIELFCTTGFDCGNGVCLSSVKVGKPIKISAKELNLNLFF